MAEEEYLSLGIEYLGFLNGQLRDLRGYSTLAHELIQNADDAPGATSIVFDVRDDALIIENDGVFSDCGDMESRDCLWLRDPSRRHRCDFHRLRLTASGDKRRQANTTGAFGVGFIAVYQITDRPELISNGRHWIIRPELPDQRRIRILSTDGEMHGTRFRFPWAFGGGESIRTELGVEPVQPDDVHHIAAELSRALPSAILFLRKLNRIQLSRNGAPVLRVERIEDGDKLLVETEYFDPPQTKLAIWHILRGDFTGQADGLRARAYNQIEQKRSATVLVAVPGDDTEGEGLAGLFHAYLPTQHRIRLPLHVNADFYTTNDRKQILFGADYQGDWNRAAVDAAADVLAKSLPQLRDALGYQRFWPLLNRIYELSREVEQKRENPIYKRFWLYAESQLRNFPVVFTSRGQWKTPEQTLLLQSRDSEGACLGILESLNLHIAHPEIGSYANLLRNLGVPYLSATHLAQALKNSGLDEPVPIAQAPDWIQSAENRDLLADEIGILTNRPGSGDDLESCLIALSAEGWLCPISDLRRASAETQAALSILERHNLFASSDNPQQIAELIPDFQLKDCVRSLAATPADIMAKLWREKPEEYIALITWFAERPTEVRSDRNMAEQLAQLAVWPSGNTLHPLADLVVPGGFRDPLGLTQVVDARVVDCCGNFLKEDLHARSLTLQTYVVEHVPRAFSSTMGVDEAHCRELIRIIAVELNKIRGNAAARSALASCPIVECTDGVFRPAVAVHFRTKLVTSVLGDEIAIAQPPSGDVEAIVDLQKWLGVESIPRPKDIVDRIEEVTQAPPTGFARSVVQEIYAQLGSRWAEVFSDQEVEFSSLKDIAWLPAHADFEKWYRPADVYADYRRHLFASQARFLDIPSKDQDHSRPFIGFLDIEWNPTVLQVVRHLGYSVAHNDTDLSFDVYTELNRHADDPQIASLKGTKCLLSQIGGQSHYIYPRQAFWGEHHFGDYRFKLGDKFRDIGRLLKALGVRDAPTAQDATEVLRDISEAMGHSLLDQTTHDIVLQCWKMLDYALSNEEIEPARLTDLSDVGVVPNDRDQLLPPRWIYFDDRPALKAKFDGFLSPNVIPRPQGAWRAMQAAGVRFLSEAVETHIVECRDPKPDLELTTCKQARADLIQRVLETQGTDVWSRFFLERLEIQSAERLMITHTVSAFKQTRTTPPEETQAYYDSESERILVVRNGDTPWSALARELTYALAPRLEAGLVAPALKEVLQSRSAEGAERELTELGFAVWESTDDLVVPTTRSVDPGGTDPEATPDGFIPDTPPVDSQASSLDQPPTPSIVTTGTDDGESDSGNADVTPQDTVTDEDTDPDQPTVQPPIIKKPLSGGGRLRTYVSKGTASSGSGTSHVDEWLEIDRAGVDHVLVHEREAGRCPKEMPHENPGYDVESCDQEGHLLRYIEVKSTSGKWSATGVAMSETQFEMAQKQGGLFWLYVVAHAKDENFQVYTIQDPANRVDQFFYDEGWRAVASEDSEIVEIQPTSTRRRTILDVARDT